MITAQDIREKTFQKASMKGGYSMEQVDEFLDELAADVAAMAKENASLQSKMRVLVDTVEEYRQTEDSMRLALLSAQKMSAQIESEAREKADNLVAKARDTADRLTRQATAGIANEEAKLEEAKKATEKFFEHMRTVCEKQIDFYERLSQMSLVTAEEAETTLSNIIEEPEKTPALTEESALENETSDEEMEAETEAEEIPTDDVVKSIETAADQTALEEPEDSMEIDTALPEEEDEPTRRIGEEPPVRKRRGFDDFQFDDDI